MELLTLDLLLEGDDNAWRTVHYLIAEELLKQLLWPMSTDRDRLWRQGLSNLATEFARFVQEAEHEPGRQMLDLLQRLYIYRDNVELLGTERSALRQYSQLIEDIPSWHGRKEALETLVELFPEEAHFHAHVGRLLGHQGRFSDAHARLQTAIDLSPKDYVLHHMRGMIYRYQISDMIDQRKPLNEVVGAAKAAQACFREARDLDDQHEHGYISEVQVLIAALDYAGRVTKQTVRECVASANADPFLREAMETAEMLLDRVRNLRMGERPSHYESDCRARLNRIYGDHKSALQTWDSLLSRKDVVKAPIRRQIVWTLLRRSGDRWDALRPKDISRSISLLQENLDEQPNDATSLRLWLRAVRHADNPPGLHHIIEKVGYWKANTASLEATFYLYVLHSLDALDGADQARADAERALDECQTLARFRRDRTLSFEWIGAGTGISRLVHQSQLGDWSEGFWERRDVLQRIKGRIASIDAPQKGRIELEGGLMAFFVPAVAGFYAGRDENVAVTSFVGFAYEGIRAWEVERR